MLSTTARMTTPFFIIHLGTPIELDGATLGLLSLAFLGADTLANLVWGYLGDQTGFKLVFATALTIWIGATILLMFSEAMPLVFLGFCGLGAAQSGYMMSAQIMILEFGPRDDLPMRIGVSNSAEAITATAGPLLGGIMAQTLGYTVVFSISLAFLAIALALLMLAVEDPRRKGLAT